eukprot:COSAG02_NODE_16503_length_1078_cov_1.570991_2_plen_42_part_01
MQVYVRQTSVYTPAPNGRDFPIHNSEYVLAHGEAQHDKLAYA